MRIEKKEKVKEKARGKALEIQEEVKITQGEESLILEKGDRIQVVKESIDPDLQKVVDIANSTEGIFGLQKPLERVFGKGNATFYNSSVLVVKTRRGRKIMIASPSNVELDGTEIPVQDGKLYVGYAD
ncbi:MAG: hypothetical protein EOM67_07845 [Spirochaetia bacterium]|nr:hypothetical protein [Spirochaetia bacterium]